MKPSTHETAPHGLAPLPAHPGGTMSGLDMHRCLTGALVAATVAVLDLPVMYRRDCRFGHSGKGTSK